MEKAYDLVIRGGSVVDGTGAAPFEADAPGRSTPGARW
jgi:N-acyl-D-aspartate/D-glutamate deacylase